MSSFDKVESNAINPLKKKGTIIAHNNNKLIQRNESALNEAFIQGLKQFYSQ